MLALARVRTAGGDFSGTDVAKLVAVAWAELRDQYRRFAVADNGIGLDMMRAQRIFEMFHRLHRDGEHERHRHRLTLCKRIVVRHGGRIWVESVPSQGATFMFTLGERGSL